MYDVIIIGAGIIGATMARELARYQLKVLVVDKHYDVAMEATMANSAIVHSGHDPRPGTLKARFNVAGNRMYPAMCEELDIPFVRTGGLVVATTPAQEATLHVLRNQALANGLSKDEARLIHREEILHREPNIADGVTMALDLPTTAVTFPWEAAIANLENAIENGVEMLLECDVQGIRKNEHFVLTTSQGTFASKVVINAAGIHADDVMGMYTTPHFAIHPRRGEYYVLDRDVYDVTSVIYPVPDEKGKGVLITPQYHGNVLIGPTSEEVAKSEVHRTTPSGLEYIKRHAATTMKNIPYDKVIRSFAGGRASSTQYDFIIEDVNQSGFINLAGIESPGLTAAPAIPPYVVDTFLRHHLTLTPDETFQPRRRRVIRLNEMDVVERNRMVSEHPSYGRMICRCEGITEGEIRDVIRRPAGARSVVGVKNRSRAGAGRCQGGFCQSDVIRILAEELGIDKQQVNYSKSNTPILLYETKGDADENL